MKKPNKFLTILFFLAIGYAIYNLVAPSGKEKTGQTPGEATTYPADTMEFEKTMKEQPGSTKDSARKERQKMLAWGEDPFIFPKEMDPYHKRKKAYPKKAATNPLKGITTKGYGHHKLISLEIHSILISQEQRAATINRAPYVVTIGDRIGDVQVLDIMADRVVFGRDGKTQEILLRSKAQ